MHYNKSSAVMRKLAITGLGDSVEFVASDDRPTHYLMLHLHFRRPANVAISTLSLRPVRTHARLSEQGWRHSSVQVAAVAISVLRTVRGAASTTTAIGGAGSSGVVRA